MILAEVEKSTPHGIAPVLAQLVKDRLINILQVRNDAAKEVVKNPFFGMVGEVIFDIIQPEKMD